MSLNFFSLSGRLPRLDYFISLLFAFVAFILTILLSGSFHPKSNLQYIPVLLMLGIIFFVFVQGAKRCHDIGLSGWWQLIPFYFLYLLIKNGDFEPNKYGNRPVPLSQVAPPKKKIVIDPALEQKYGSLTSGELLTAIQNELEKMKAESVTEFSPDLHAMLCFAGKNPPLAAEFFEEYEKKYKRNLVDEIGYICPDFKLIPDYLSSFIANKVVSENYPHRRTF
jgi:uncharacterized membrane protein YhaH (DUF805 family)